MIDTPEYDELVAEFGDPFPVAAAIAEVTEAAPPEIAKVVQE